MGENKDFPNQTEGGYDYLSDDPVKIAMTPTGRTHGSRSSRSRCSC
jgi:hypothetical protein